MHINILMSHTYSADMQYFVHDHFSRKAFFFSFLLTGQHMVTWTMVEVVICKHVSLQNISMIYINAYQIPQRKTAFLIYTFRTNDISKNICSTTFHRQVPCLQEMGRIERLQCQNQKALALSRYELDWNAIYFRNHCSIELAEIKKDIF